MIRRLAHLLLVAAAVLLLASASFAAFRLVRADVHARVYQDRLRDLAAQHHRLAQRYNDAVRRTAVTELLVEDGTLWLLYRTAEGPLALVRTPYDPAREVFADFIVRDGRLLTRRVYDDTTAPAHALVLDDAFLGYSIADEADPDARVLGKTIYRSLRDGRWRIDVTGNGSLDLVRVGDLPPGGVDAVRAEAERLRALHHAPSIDDFEHWAAAPDTTEAPIGPAELWRAFLGD